MANRLPNVTPACNYPVEPAAPTTKGAKGEATGGTLKPSQRPSKP